MLRVLAVALLLTEPALAQSVATTPNVLKSLDGIAGLSTEQKLKAENFQLKAQNAQLLVALQQREAQLREVELLRDQTTLVESFRATLKADQAAVFDWATLTFKPPVSEAKGSR